jgi:plastocyanin
MTMTTLRAVPAPLLAAALLLGASQALAGDIQGQLPDSLPKGEMVVYVAKADGNFQAPNKHALVDQKKMKFIPYLLPILVGTTVDFHNGDTVNHNVFSPDGEGYNLGTFPPGESRSYTFKKTGVYTQLCSIHPEMEGFVIVLQNPYFAVSEQGKSFKIQNVPDGHYLIKVWGKKLKKPQKEKTFAVDVAGGKGTVSIAF